ncbi:MHF histone-fold complex component [Knufia peltigerae]|uniref:MHF histone-fold complex component n=1 Tax=Knufia peltigerae TaxID=1002370 RepID=A0AA38YCA8_9EURO|nr:MHF histone-fold complex component [Knufia peltigerae]
MASTTELDAETLQKKLRSALWFQVGKIVDEESINLGVNATPQFIGSLMELVWAQIGNNPRPRPFAHGNIAVDLESFAKHAGRTTIKTDDVMLLTRRNEGLETILREELKKLEHRKDSHKEK